MDEALVQLVRARAGGRCEYCGVTATVEARPFETEHVVARKHLGPSVASNLALSCVHCNRHKGTDPAGFDRVSGRPKLTILYHPRRHRLGYHFSAVGAAIRGRTAIGRVTVQVLAMNDPVQLSVRLQLLNEGHCPPSG